MADQAGSFYGLNGDGLAYYSADKDHNRGGSVYGLQGAPGSINTTKYVMRGLDPDCVGIVYRTWVVEQEPDYTGAQYTGPRCGATPLSGIVVTSAWIETR